MKIGNFIKFSVFGLKTVLFKKQRPILGTIILTDKCNLSCKHCTVNNITAVLYPYKQIRKEMKLLYNQGVRILFFCGGETFMWKDMDKTLRNLVIEAKMMGFKIVNTVTNGTFSLDLPEADLILLSLDGNKKHHDDIRGKGIYEKIMDNIKNASADNICLYMAINNINKGDIKHVCEIAQQEKNITAASFNFHTPYPGTDKLSLTLGEKRQCGSIISHLIDNGYPIFNLKRALPYIINNNFPTPCHQCVIIENGKQLTCGRCVEIDGLCAKCGYFFAAEYSLAFQGNVKVIIEMLKTYPRYV